LRKKILPAAQRRCGDFFQQTRRAWTWHPAIQKFATQTANTHFINPKRSYKVSGKNSHGLGDVNAMPKTGGLLKCSEAAE
jgi:hypothetical protein